MGKHFFVFIWVCSQAVDATYGMPVAWTHRDSSPGRPYMSDNGYVNPDSGVQCYIGFNEASPVIGNWTRSFEQQMTLPVKFFIMDFYCYALYHGYSVKDALNQASLNFFGSTYTSSILYTGYKTWFPGGYWPADFYWGWMKVYGNGNIHLAPQYNFVVLAKEGATYFPNKDVCIDIPYNIANTGATIKVTRGAHTFYVNEFWEPGYTGWRYYFHHWEPGPGWQIYYQPLPWDFDDDLTITAYFTKEHYPGDVDGDRDADQADWNYFLGSYPSARGDDSYDYDSRCDFNSDGYINYGDYSYLYSIIFPSHWLTVPAYDNYGSPVTANVYIDSQYAGTTGNSFIVSQGVHTLQVSVPSGYSFQKFTYNGYDDYNNPTTISVTSDVAVTAHYVQLPTHWVTVNAYNQYYYPGSYIPVYVDGQWAGYTGSAFSVSEGTHTIAVPYYVDDYYDNYCHFD